MDGRIVTAEITEPPAPLAEPLAGGVLFHGGRLGQGGGHSQYHTQVVGRTKTVVVFSPSKISKPLYNNGLTMGDTGLEPVTSRV